MPKSPYYVYALKDPRTGKPFYVGKGTGVRAWEHEVKPDKTRKGKRIAEIRDAGGDVLVSTLADDLSELQALKLEAELISAFGTETTGGPLTNAVMPTGESRRRREAVVVPSGIAEKAQMSLQLLKDSVLELTKANPEGVTNSEVVRSLGLQSDYLAAQKTTCRGVCLGY